MRISKHGWLRSKRTTGKVLSSLLPIFLFSIFVCSTVLPSSAEASRLVKLYRCPDEPGRCRYVEAVLDWFDDNAREWCNELEDGLDEQGEACADPESSECKKIKRKNRRRANSITHKYNTECAQSEDLSDFHCILVPRRARPLGGGRGDRGNRNGNRGNPGIGIPGLLGNGYGLPGYNGDDAGENGSNFFYDKTRYRKVCVSKKPSRKENGDCLGKEAEQYCGTSPVGGAIKKARASCDAFRERFFDLMDEFDVCEQVKCNDDRSLSLRTIPGGVSADWLLRDGYSPIPMCLPPTPEPPVEVPVEVPPSSPEDPTPEPPSPPTEPPSVVCLPDLGDQRSLEDIELTEHCFNDPDLLM